MKNYNKVHEYKDAKFNVKVELNFQIEKRLNGKREHNVTVNDMGPSNYYQAHLFETQNLEEGIDLMIEEAEKWYDRQLNQNKSPEEILLEALGFK